MANKGWTQVGSALATAADCVGDSIDFRGYKEVSVQTKFATCSGSGNVQTLMKIQTSNDGDNWVDHTTIKDEASNNAEDFSGDGYHTSITGFGRYLRWAFDSTIANTFSISFVITFEAKE